MTSFVNTNLYAFITLVQQEPQLFAPEYRDALLQLTNTYPEDANNLSENLLAWCEPHALIQERLESYRRAGNLPADRIPPGVNPDSKEAERICINMLRNALQTSVPSTPTSATSPQPSVTVPAKNDPHASR